MHDYGYTKCKGCRERLKKKSSRHLYCEKQECQDKKLESYKAKQRLISAKFQREEKIRQREGLLHEPLFWKWCAYGSCPRTTKFLAGRWERYCCESCRENDRDRDAELMEVRIVW